VGNPALPNDEITKPPALYWRRVSYSGDIQRAILDEVVRQYTVWFGDRLAHLMSDLPVFIYWNAASLMKHERFADEREVRMTAWIPEGIDALDFRASRFGITPFVQITGSSVVGQDRPYVVGQAEPLPLKHVRVGPCAYPQAHIFGVRRALEAFGYGDVETTSSGVPLR
jgi:hypothetical protein